MCTEVQKYILRASHAESTCDLVSYYSCIYLLLTIRNFIIAILTIIIVVLILCDFYQSYQYSYGYQSYYCMLLLLLCLSLLAFLTTIICCMSLSRSASIVYESHYASQYCDNCDYYCSYEYKQQYQPCFSYYSPLDTAPTQQHQNTYYKPRCTKPLKFIVTRLQTVTVWGQLPKQYYRGLNNYLDFLGVPHYKNSIIYPKTLV